MGNTIVHTAWFTDPHCFKIGNILIDSSEATLDKAAWHQLHANLALLKMAPDTKKHPKASKQLVSFQNRKWIYTLLQNT